MMNYCQDWLASCQYSASGWDIRVVQHFVSQCGSKHLIVLVELYQYDLLLFMGRKTTKTKPGSINRSGLLILRAGLYKIKVLIAIVWRLSKTHKFFCRLER